MDTYNHLNFNETHNRASKHDIFYRNLLGIGILNPFTS